MYIYICANIKKHKYIYLYTVVYAYYTNYYIGQEMAMGCHPKNKTCRSFDRLRPLHVLYMFKSMMYVPDN